MLPAQLNTQECAVRFVVNIWGDVGLEIRSAVSDESARIKSRKTLNLQHPSESNPDRVGAEGFGFGQPASSAPLILKDF
jgi:hypothetical protein